MAGVTITLIGSGSTSTTTDSIGNYSFSGAANGNYTIIPSLTGYVFIPESLSVTVNDADLKSQNFTETPNDVGKITDLYVRNDDSLDYNSTPILDWTPVIAAKWHNVYCQVIEYFYRTDETIARSYSFVGKKDFSGTSLTNLTSLAPGTINSTFVEENQIKLSYNCFVRCVNADEIEGRMSNVVYIEDRIAPQVISSEINYFDYPIGDPPTPVKIIDSIKVCFSEYMREATVENKANWTLNPAAFDGTAPDIQFVDYPATQLCAYVYLNQTGVGPVTYAAQSPVNLISFGPGIKDVSGNDLPLYMVTFAVGTP